MLNSKALATVEAQEVDAALHVPLDAHHSDTIDPIGVGADIVNSDREAIDTDDVPEEKSNSDADEMELSSAARRLIASTGGVGLAIGSSMGAPWLAPISLFTTVALAAPIFRDAYRATVEEKKLKVDVLDTAIISLCLIFRKFGPAAFMVWILDLADLLLDKTTERSREYVTEVFGEQPRSAWLLVDGKEIQVPVTTLKRGDEIVVGTGEQVPVDGIVLDGDAMIDQQSLTGEAAPAEKRKGDQVFAMTVVVAGQIYVEVTETGENTLAAQIIQIVNDAAAFKVDVQSRGERIADDMVLPTFGLGAVAYLFSGTSALLATINADYGTGIRVAAPIALLASLGNAAKNGILVKDSKVFELLSDIDVVLFDKTGTLTYDVPIVSQIVPANGSINPDTLLFYAAAAEQKFSHPIAKAILQEAEQKSMMLPVLDESTYHVGFGIQVSLDDRVIKIGSSRYMDREGISMPPLIHETLQESRLRGNSAILIAIEDEVAGMIEMQSTPREEATHVIDFLKTQGISEIVLISGDHEAPTQELARQLDIPQFVAGVLPHEKADYVRSYQTDGKKVMMVGDGINDSAALSLADVSISLKGASTIAVDVADVIFMDGSLRRFDYLYTVTKKLDRNVRRSFSMIAIPNTLCITGAILGLFGLSGSLILNNGFNILAAFNGMLLHIGQDTESQAQQTNKQPLNL
ncbi:MAG: heavy metal translocating P-type ATPase [Chloroflexota bacterium]